MKRAIAIISCLLPLYIAAQVSSVHITVHVPSSTTKDVYIAGNFNHWFAGDPMYKLKKVNDSVYTLTLPAYTNIKYEYKYTVGGWTEVEKTFTDGDTENRSFVVSRKKAKHSDTVARWAVPKPVPQKNNTAQLQKLNGMKDSALAKLQPHLGELLVVLKQYTINLLQEKPDEKISKEINDKLGQHFADAFGTINQMVKQLFASIPPDQKQKILASISDPANTDFINTFIKAFGEAMQVNSTPQ